VTQEQDRLLEIIDLADSGQVQLALTSSQGRRTASPVTFKAPLTGSDLTEIGWYFNEYLRNPFGDAKARAGEVETRFHALGRSLFETVFQSSEEAQSCYGTALEEGLPNYQLVIVSHRPEFLSLPWELLNSPEAGFLPAQFGSMLRRTSSGPMDPFVTELSQEQLNVLLVSPSPTDSLPDGDPSGDAGSIAAEALQILESLDVVVQLDCLQPPTLDALADRLAQIPGHYHLVHIDAQSNTGGGGILLESNDGNAAQVASAQVAELLVKSGVPMVLINGGGAASPNQSTNTAAELSEAGVPLVVSMAVPLTPTARSIFVGNLFRQIVAGVDVPTAASTARRGLMDEPLRPCAAGKAPFWDWIAPQVYQSRSYVPGAIHVEQPEPLTPQSQPEEGTELDQQLPQEGPYGLVGRRAELRQLARTFPSQQVVLMSSNTGAGKTELALGLARWLQKTGARPGGVFYTTFHIGAGLERVVHEIGTAVAGLSFADMSGPDQRQWVVDYLREQPSLIIWDALQHAGGDPGQDGSGMLDQAELAELDAFLAEAIQGGRSWALLVTRHPEEPWLAVPYHSYQLPILSQSDRMELACKIQESTGPSDLTPGGQADNQLGLAYLELLDLIEGHPLAMQIALPLLKEVPASVLLGEMRTRVEELDQSSMETGRDLFLTAVMDQSFSRMPRRSRTHLPFLSMFQQRVMLDILTHITQERAYQTVMGEELGWGACRTLLRSARDAGFIQTVTPSVYQIHPTLPWFYGRQINQQLSPAAIRQLEQEFVRVYADTADYFMETLYENQDSGTMAVLAEEGNLTQALGLALEDHQWDAAQVLVQPLAQVYRMQKRYPELRRLRRQLLQDILPEGNGATEADSKGAIDLWLYLLGTEASEATEQLNLEFAQDLNQQMMDYLESLPDKETDPRVAAVYHQMGVLEQHRWHLDDAEEWYQKSLVIIEKGEDEASTADDYYCIGQVKQHQRYYTEAKEWFSKALDVHQRLQDPEELVKDFRALGLASQFKFEYDEAESWYRRAQAILEENRDEEMVVLVYHELGTVFHARYMFEEAESWYQQSLGLSHRLGLQSQMAVEFHYLGLLAQARGLLYEMAQEWFELALEKREELGDPRGAGDECRQLGVLFHEQNLLDDAEQWYQRARENFEQIRDVDRTARTYGQLGKLAEDRGDLPQALEWATRAHGLATEHQLPALAPAKAHLAALRDKYGVDNFQTWWRGFTGGDPPDDLDEE